MDVKQLVGSGWAVAALGAAAVSLVVSLMLSVQPSVAVMASALAGGATALYFRGAAVLAADRRAERMERELPAFISSLLTVFSERKNMHDALLVMLGNRRGGTLEREAEEAFANYRAGVPAEKAFAGLRSAGSRPVARVFDWIVRALETGLDVSEPLSMLAGEVAKTLELKQEKSSKTGIAVWMMAASSAFFFPLFAALVLVVMSAIERIASLELYSPAEKGFLMLILLAYAAVGTLIDAGHAGLVRYGSFRRGVLAYFPAMCATALGVFLVVGRLAESFLG